MKKIKYLLPFLTVMFITTGVISAQEEKPDTADVRLQQKEQQEKQQQKQQGQNQDQSQTQNPSQNQAQTGTDTQAKAQGQGDIAQGVKKVQSARPDWSKARGARPSSVERPSGSRIPKGAGKPGGAKGPGKR